MRWYFLLSLYFFILGNWLLSLTSLDEGRNADAIQNMLKSQDFLIPLYNCQYRFEKPPLLYWAGSLSSLLFGLNEFSLRLVSGLSAVFLGFLVYLIGKRSFDAEVGKRASLVFLSIPHLWIESRAFVPEMLLTLLMTAGLYLWLSERYTLGWLFVALAFLSKGPVGLFLPLGVYLLISRDTKVLRPIHILLFLALGGWWYLYMLHHFGQEYFHRFFLQENLQRFTGDISLHSAPWYFYILLVLLNTVFFLPSYYRLIKGFSRKHLPLLLWALLVIGFFSLSANKLHHYILFAYVPLSVLIASQASINYIKRVLTLCALLMVVLLVGVHLFEKSRFVPKAYPLLSSWQGGVYFYNTENSALVFYSKRCIQKTDRIPSGEVLLVVKGKDSLNGCKVILEGREFEGVYTLQRCGM